MEKKYILLTLIGSLLISGCQPSNNSDSTSSSSISLTPFALMLNKYKKGVQLEGEVNQKVYFLDETGEKTGKETSNAYNVSFTYQSIDENAYAGYIAQRLPNNEEYIYVNNRAFEGKDGFSYYYDLNKKHMYHPAFPYILHLFRYCFENYQTVFSLWQGNLFPPNMEYNIHSSFHWAYPIK